MIFGEPHLHFDSCESTNDTAMGWCMQQAGAAPNGAVVTARHQSKGKGSRGRSWTSDAGDSLLMSVIIRPSDFIDVMQLGFLASLAVVQALVAHGIDAKVKWPNDVLVDRRKIAGVLVDYWIDGASAVVGIGVNVKQKSFSTGSFRTPPTSVDIVLGSDASIDRIFSDILACMSHLDTLRRSENGWTHLRHMWLDSVDHSVAVESGHELAKFVDVNEDGSALVRMDDGTLRTWTSVSR